MIAAEEYNNYSHLVLLTSVMESITTSFIQVFVTADDNNSMAWQRVKISVLHWKLECDFIETIDMVFHPLAGTYKISKQ